MNYSVFRNVLFLLKDIKKEYPLLLFLIFMQMVLSVVSPVFGIYIPKLALDLVLEGADGGRIFLVLGGFGLIMAFSMGLSGLADEGKYMMYNDMRRYYQTKLLFQSLSCDYRHVESREGQGKYQKAMSTLQSGDWSGTSRMLVATIDMVVNTLCFVIYSGIVWALSPLMILTLIALSLVSLISTRRAQGYEHSRRDETADYDKKLGYINRAGSDVRCGKDMRLYRTQGWFVDLRDSLIDRSARLVNQIQNRYFASGAVNALVLLLRDGIAYVYLIYGVASGRITLPDFTLYFGAVTAFSGFVGRMVNSFNELNGANLQMNTLRAFLDQSDEPEPEEPKELSELKDFSIEFRDVCFSYQADSRKVLDHFSMKIRQGEKIALVGVNGAGKTTMIKLLCGFYRPDSGQILIGGEEIGNFRKKDLLRLFSAVFQDIYIPPFTVLENVSMREREKTDKARAEKCLRKAGLWEKISSCEAGMDTPMTREITEGIVLSGGEQQKLLMARALYKDAPILILDEPTAALDPIAESQTYGQFQEIASDKTAIYISHRLASTRFCDRILFLSGGRITEEGSHEELMEQDGDYREMFLLQSKYYREGKEEREDAKS